MMWYVVSIHDCVDVINISPTLLWKHPDPSLLPLYCAAFVFTLQRIYLLHVSINQIANTFSIHIVIWWWNNVLIKHWGCSWHDIVCPGGGSRSSISSFKFVTCSIAQLSVVKNEMGLFIKSIIEILMWPALILSLSAINPQNPLKRSKMSVNWKLEQAKIKYKFKDKKDRGVVNIHTRLLQG